MTDTFTKNYVAQHTKEIMSLYSVLYTMLELEPDFYNEKNKTLEEVAAYYTMMSFLYFSSNFMIAELKEKIEKSKIDIDNEFHNEFITEILKLSQEHNQRLRDAKKAKPKNKTKE